jgi:hypothetical protein
MAEMIFQILSQKVIYKKKKNKYYKLGNGETWMKLLEHF